MKQLFSLILTLYSTAIFGQDVIVKKDGSAIVSKVIEIGTSEVKYKKFSNPNGPIYAIDKSEILSINYENGEKETFGSSAAKSPIADISAETKSANNTYIAQCNSITPVWTEAQEMKEAKYTYNIMKVDESSIFENDDIKQTIYIGKADRRKDHWGGTRAK